MSIIRHGSLADFAAAPTREVEAKFAGLRGLRTFAALPQAARVAQPIPLQFQVSQNARGMALKSLMLTKGFEGFIGNLFNSTNDVYFLAWAWDFSGQPPVVYPDPRTTTAATRNNCLIPLKVGQVREFLGAGVVLYPAQKVTAGLALRIMLWASHEGMRDFGRTLSSIGTAISSSELTTLLSTVTAAAGVTAAIIPAATAAASKLAQTIGTLLQAESDDYVDFYEGYYPATDPWTAGDEDHTGSASDIVLTRLQ